MKTKKLYRSSTDKMIAGVCGGLGEYLNVDSTVLRLLTVLIIVFSGIFPGLLIYIVAAVIMPQKPGVEDATSAPKVETPVEESKT